MIPVGTKLAPISFKRPDGGDVSIADLAGKPVLMIFLRHLA